MKYPKYLSENGTIGFVAPSFGCNIEPYHTAFENAKEKFCRLGHSLDLGPNCYAGEGIGISNTPRKCGQELTDYYCSEKNDILISCGGGELMCEILDHLDLERISNAAPKWYMGYSDNTNFTFLLPTIWDTASVYGPCAAAFGMEPWHDSLQDAYDLLRGKKFAFAGYPLWEKESLKNEDDPLQPYHVTEPVQIRCFTEGSETPLSPSEASLEFSGRLIGGCMDILVNLLGTSYDRVPAFLERYREDGFIWFLESCDLNVFAIRRAIWQMQHAGWFKYVKGFLIGRPYCFGQEMIGLDQYRAVNDLLARYKVPIIMDMDLGHLPPMMPVICGAFATVKVSQNQYEISYVQK
ncbi:MAG TPA: LD-carboxypeptidase [Candidatus Choladousia intestinigallinarum]|nr:LD-carboxypeptidase [Candidatus Choladousia intestinigallinarum]